MTLKSRVIASYTHCMSIALADLHPAYSTATAEEAVQMANIGAVCWSTFKENLYSQWIETVTTEEATKAARYREEGRQEGRNAMADALYTAESQIQQLTSANIQSRDEGRREIQQAMDATVTHLRAALFSEQGRVEGYRAEGRASQMESMRERLSRALAAEATVTQLRTALDAEQAKVEGYRAEGRAALLDSLRERLASTETLQVRLSIAEGRAAQIEQTMAEEIERRIQSKMDGFRNEFEMAKLCEMQSLQLRVAAADAREEMVTLVKEGHEVMREKLALLEAQRESLRSELSATTTKSSSAIGKKGETMVYEMLAEILDTLPHSKLVDMTTTGHSADFHVWIMASTGQKVKILVDSKKYKRSVDKDEIHKLNMDVDADADAQCGLMVSLDSGISSTKQFQMGRTPKQKPVLYLSFLNIPVEMQKEMLSWGLRVLVFLVGERDDAVRRAMFDTIESFVAGVERSVTEMDGSIAQMLKVVDGFRKTRVCLIEQLTSFKAGKGVVDAVVEATGAAAVEAKAEAETVVPCDITRTHTCQTVYKATGKLCEMPVVAGQTTCKSHSGPKRRKATKPIISL